MSRKGAALHPYNIISGVERLPRDTSPEILCHYAGFHAENRSLGVRRWPGRGLAAPHALVVRYLVLVISMMHCMMLMMMLLTLQCVLIAVMLVMLLLSFLIKA